MTRIADMWNTARAVRSIAAQALRSGQLFHPQCDLVPADPDVLCEYDVPIRLPDGITLLAHVFRSRRAQATGTKLPVIMCAHPYDNHLLPALGRTPLGHAPQQYRLIPQVGRPRFSAITSWEAPDPNFWVAAGYAVVNVNLPGYGGSDGPATIFSPHQARCYYDAIEWVARQPWCTGAVGLSGVSYLAITQFHVAACQHYGGPPPALKCIAPWEGLTDMYRDVLCPGGIADEGFGAFWWATEVKPALTRTAAEFIAHNEGRPLDMLRRHPLYDAFWAEKNPKLDQITIPMCVCASFSDHGLHTVGSFRAFMQARSKHKWVYTHRTGKWDAYYSREVQELTLQFMDCFLKGKTDNGMLTRPPVRLEVRSDRDTVHAVRDESEWPLARTRYTPLFLTAGSLSTAKVTAEQRASHPAKRGRSQFDFTFDRDTELSGYMKLRLWVQAQPLPGDRVPPDDMGIFVAVDKLDRHGRPVRFRGSVGFAQDTVTRGLCRVSRRDLDPVDSTDWHPVPSGRTHQPLAPGQIVPVDIALYPSSTFFAAGESLRLIIASDEIVPAPPYRKVTPYNRGIHVLHMGGTYDSHLLIPVIP